MKLPLARGLDMVGKGTFAMYLPEYFIFKNPAIHFAMPTKKRLAYTTGPSLLDEMIRWRYNGTSSFKSGGGAPSASLLGLVGTTVQ